MWVQFGFASLFPDRSLSRNPMRPGTERLWSIPDYVLRSLNEGNPPAGPAVARWPGVRPTAEELLHWAPQEVHRRLASQCLRPTIQAADPVSRDFAGFRPPWWQHPGENG